MKTFGITSWRVNPFFIFFTADSKWEELHPGGERPPALQEHSAVAYKDCLYIFGGELGFSAGTETPLWVYNVKVTYHPRQTGLHPLSKNVTRVAVNFVRSNRKHRDASWLRTCVAYTRANVMSQSKTEIKNTKMSLETCSLRKSGYTFVYIQVYPIKDISSHVNNRDF